MALTRTISLSPPLDEAVRRYADAMRVSASEVHRQALAAWGPLHSLVVTQVETRPVSGSEAAR